MTLPAPVAEELGEYLASSLALPSAPMFRHPDGRPLARHHVGLAWRKARAKVGLPELHLHDLRHAGLTYVAQSGASLREIMARGGHRTVGASLIYQHMAQERDVKIAEALSAVAFQARSEAIDG